MLQALPPRTSDGMAGVEQKSVHCKQSLPTDSKCLRREREREEEEGEKFWKGLGMVLEGFGEASGGFWMGLQAFWGLLAGRFCCLLLVW